MTGATKVSVYEVDGALVVSASTNIGRWFGPADFKIAVESGEPATIGRAVREAFQHAL